MPLSEFNIILIKVSSRLLQFLWLGTYDSFISLYKEILLINYVVIIKVLQIIPTLYESGVVYRKADSSCTNRAVSVFFPIDSFTQTIQLVVIGYKNNVKIYRPDGMHQTVVRIVVETTP